MVGVGMCMEGIEQNPVVYELMSEMAFRSEKKVQLLEWLKSYSHRRYGKAIHQVEAAWEILYHTIYNCTDVIEDHNTDFIVKFPDWDPSNTSSPLPQAHLWYSTQKVINALRLLIDAGNNFARSVTYSMSGMQERKSQCGLITQEPYRANFMIMQTNSGMDYLKATIYLELQPILIIC
ncbi:hypothetical protein CMV_000840 [Castanea mollissima]|uniref:Uncharacterized protein n=1 Tax=Castanea mollissima TaxID=60419 RepID=A0A8J4W4S0_9ROSI|nr:hypothetical protein CMV_000840 [Castanea mollissima]